MILTNDLCHALTIKDMCQMMELIHYLIFIKMLQLVIRFKKIVIKKKGLKKIVMKKKIEKDCDKKDCDKKDCKKTLCQ